METSMTSGTIGGERRQITALFDNRADADAAADRIAQMGIARSDVNIVDGAATGSSTVGSTTAGADEDRGFMEKLGDFFMGEPDRHTYSEGLRRGGYVLTVMTTTADRDAVIDILDDEGTVDLDAREEEWRSDGWTDYDATTSGGSGGAGAASHTDAKSDFSPTRETADGTIEVAEEEMRVGKRETDHGRVRVRSYVVEEPVEADVSLHSEEVHVSRTPVDRDATGDAFRDQTLSAKEYSEEAVVAKEAHVTEEIRLERESKDRTETVRDTVRRTEVEVEDGRTDKDRR